MKTKYSKRKNKLNKNLCLDLFGEVIITLIDIYMWVTVVTRAKFCLQSRYDWYVKNWNVTDKIRDSKMCGRFDEIEHEFAEKYYGQAWRPDYLPNY